MSSVRCSPQISIHAPAKGATQAWTSIQPALQFQSTLPRRERLPKIPLDTKYQGISIHAPAKGATLHNQLYLPDMSISIHAPAKGATRRVAILTTFSRFQSTLPRRERRRKVHSAILQIYFNPRSREGSDYGACGSSCQRVRFQSTLPRRERRETGFSRKNIL